MNDFKASSKYLDENPTAIGPSASIPVGNNSSFASPIWEFVVEISNVLSFFNSNLTIE